MITGSICCYKAVISKFNGLLIGRHMKSEWPFQSSLYWLLLFKFSDKILKGVDSFSGLYIFSINETVVQNFCVLVKSGLILGLSSDFVKASIHEVDSFLEAH